MSKRPLSKTHLVSRNYANRIVILSFREIMCGKNLIREPSGLVVNPSARVVKLEFLQSLIWTIWQHHIAAHRYFLRMSDNLWTLNCNIVKQQFLSGRSSRGRALTDEYGGMSRWWYEIRTNDDEVEKDNYDDEENIETHTVPKANKSSVFVVTKGQSLKRQL